MPFPAVSAYEILDIDPSTSLPEITRAVPRAMKAGRYPQQVISQAYQDLRNERKRAAQDLFVISGLEPTDRIAERLREQASFVGHTATIAAAANHTGAEQHQCR